MLCMRRALASAAMAVAFAMIGCGSDLPEIDCGAEPTIPTYAEVDIFTATCNGCHASTVTGAARFSAPANVNFDTYPAAQSAAEQAVEQVYGGAMPPSGFTATEEQKHELYVWGLCGTPP